MLFLNWSYRTQYFNLAATGRSIHSMLTIVGLALVAHAALILPLPLVWQAGATLMLTGLLPGVLLIYWLTSAQTQQIPKAEQILYSIGVGYGVIIIIMLLLSYLPGGIEWWQTILVFDGLLLGLMALVLLVPSKVDHVGVNETATPTSLPAWLLPTPTTHARLCLVGGILVLALFGGFFRFADLSYSDFQGDEARAVMRAAETIQGYRDALLGHKKGPGEILIPAVIYSLTGRIDEASARLPFALANFTALFALFLLGYRLFGPLAGWVAAMLLAVDGYFVGFAHIVQYQSIVFLTVVLTVLLLHRLASKPDHLPQMLMLAALLLTTGLLCHYEAGLVIFPAGWLLLLIVRQVGPKKLVVSSVIPTMVSAGLLALFYVPFILNPNFAITLAYITVNRIGVSAESGGFPYNNLVDVFGRSTLYSSSYYIFFLIGMMVLALAVRIWRGLRDPWRGIAIGIWLAGMALTFCEPDWGMRLTSAGDIVDFTGAFFGLAILAVWIMPRVSWQERTIWLWFGGPMLLSLFGIATPNTHVYGFFIGWSLLVGMMVERLWQWLVQRISLRFARPIGVATAAILMLLFGNYGYWFFVHNQVEVLRTWQTNRPAGYWVPYTMPTSLSIFGFPFRNGWKAVGALYADGSLEGAFDTNAVDAVADWYTRGSEYCPRDRHYFILSQPVEPARAEAANQLQQTLEQTHPLWGTILVQNEPRLWIYEKGLPTNSHAEGSNERQVNEAEMTAFYDATLSGPIFERSGSISQSLMERILHENSQAQPLDFYMGVPAGDPKSAIRLRGFQLQDQNVNPGGEVMLTLYWEARQPTEKPYAVTTQLLDPADFHKVGQRDGEPICNMRPTNTWLPGEFFADTYRIPVDLNAAPGTYQVRIGLYDREMGESLEAFTPAGDLVGNGLGISQIDVVRP